MDNPSELAGGQLDVNIGLELSLRQISNTDHRIQLDVGTTQFFAEGKISDAIDSPVDHLFGQGTPERTIQLVIPLLVRRGESAFMEAKDACTEDKRDSVANYGRASFTEGAIIAGGTIGSVFFWKEGMEFLGLLTAASAAVISAGCELARRDIQRSIPDQIATKLWADNGLVEKCSRLALLNTLTEVVAPRRNIE